MPGPCFICLIVNIWGISWLRLFSGSQASLSKWVETCASHTWGGSEPTFRVQKELDHKMKGAATDRGRQRQGGRICIQAPVQPHPPASLMLHPHFPLRECESLVCCLRSEAFSLILYLILKNPSRNPDADTQHRHVWLNGWVLAERLPPLNPSSAS